MTKRASREDIALITLAGALFAILAAILVIIFVSILDKAPSLKGLATCLAIAGLLAPFFYMLYRLIRARLDGQPLGSGAPLDRVSYRAPQPEARLALSPKAERAGLRCVYCHDAFDTRPVTLCPCCEARLHPECWQEAGACPTIGCEAARPSERGRGEAEKLRG